MNFCLNPPPFLLSCLVTMIGSKALNNGNWIDVISLDYSKAFDRVSHKKLQYKFKQYGFNNKMCA